ncbi:MAG: phosphoribosyltransferase [Deltaproteobacteria bacterium]|nr:phosphoribosyltransferase [Deltaproteobacteria bacterium]
MPTDDSSSAPGQAVRELSWKSFDALALELARGLASDWEPEAVVGVAKGGVFVGGVVAAALKRDFYPVRISRRSRDHIVRTEPKAFGTMPRELRGLRVLIVDDVAASGDTLELATKLAKRVGAAEVKTATLAVKQKGYRPDFFAMQTDDLLVFPWDYDFFAGPTVSEPPPDEER